MKRDKFVPLGYVKSLLGLLCRSARDRKKVIVLTNGRTGSTLLVESLGQIKNVSNHGELAHWPFFSLEGLLRYVCALSRQDVVVFKILGYQLDRWFDSRDMATLREEVLAPHNLVIHLVRDTERRAASKKRAFATGEWHRRGKIGSSKKKLAQTQGSEEPIKNEDLVHERELEDRHDKLFEEIGLFDRSDVLKVDYDQHLKTARDLRMTAERVAKRLGSSVDELVPMTDRISRD